MNGLSNMRVLIAEDDFDSRVLLETILEKWGYEVVVANDGAAAWRILDADNAPSIAVLDWMMPHLSGVQLCERIRQRDQELMPYIVMSATRGEKADVSAGLEAGADDYLLKPFDFTELSARLRVAKRAVAMQRDLNESRKAVVYQALHDVSTGALNRGAALNQLSATLASQARATVGLLGVDQHKWILQHEGADSAESAVRALVHAIRAQCPDALIGRYCADELLVIWHELDSEKAVRDIERARRALAVAAAAQRPGSGKPVTFSCGLTPATGDSSLELLLYCADTALCAARVPGDSTEVLNMAHRSTLE